jgi:hypothetical protein
LKGVQCAMFVQTRHWIIDDDHLLGTDLSPENSPRFG